MRIVGQIQFWRGCKRGGGIASNLEHLPLFSAPREGGLGPRKNADSVHAKKLHDKGTDRRTLQLYERIGLRADSLKINILCSKNTIKKNISTPESAQNS